MKYRQVFSVLTVGALAIAAGVGLFAYRSASAQSSTPTAPSVQAPAGPDVVRGGHGLRGGITDEDLAAALGITTDELNTAQETANNAAIDQAVADGLITQAQADEIRANGSAFPFGGRWGGWLEQSGIDYEALLADALGITPDQLQAAYAQAYNARIDQAVADGTLTQEQADLMKGQYALSNSESFQSSMQSAYQAAVQQAVTDGVITQAQADQILNQANQMGGFRMGGFGLFEGGRGPRGGGHGFGGPDFGGGAPANPAVPQQPSATPSSGL